MHGRFLARRAEWFEPMDVASHVIWPVKAGHVPDLIEGKEKLVSLRENGPTDAAYDFKYKNSSPSGSVA